ncbi:MAG: ABC transporter substrate-binding protein [Chloroflexota bacterium]
MKRVNTEAKPTSLFRVVSTLLAIIMVASVLAACGAPADAPAPDAAESSDAATDAGSDGGDAAMSDSKEAPALAEMVAAGTLPPLEERLPLEPMVVEPEESIGTYGGTWRAGLRGGSDRAWIYRTIGYEQMTRWERDWSGVRPNVAQGWDVSEDSTEYTFYLREGMRWSDGEPFTSDDVVFWYEDVLMNEELTPSVPNWLMAGDEPVAVEAVDDYTVKFSFAAPNGTLLMQLASASGPPPTSYPRHYMEQFHIKYNEDAAATAEAEGYEDWVAYFQAINGGGCCGYFSDAGLPVLWGWKLDTAYGETTTTIRAVRNPYYWKVDTDGNQLPYIDEVVYDVGNDVETLVLKALNGEIDYQDRHIATFNNKAVFFDGMEAGGYRLTDRVSANNNVMEISLNLTHPDEAMRELFNNLDFRAGLSHAINRQEIIDLVYVGQGEPWQAAPLPSSPYYNERLGTQYLDYSTDTANELLDAAGLTETDGDGFRMYNGERLTFLIDVPTVSTEHIDMLELIKGYWAEVGIDMTPNVVDRSLGQQRLEANEHDANVWGAPGGIGFGTLLDPRNFLPMHGHSRYGILWYYYWQNPENEAAEEPPAAVMEQFDLYRTVLATADPATQTELMQQIMEIAADQFYMIGISKPSPSYAVANKDLRNIMDGMPGAWQYPTPGPADPEQWFFDR